MPPEGNPLELCREEKNTNLKKLPRCAEICCQAISHVMCHQNDVPMIKISMITGHYGASPGFLMKHNSGQNILLSFWILVEANLSLDVKNA
jgi:hypothetical protein